MKYCIIFTDNTIPVVYHRLVHLISAFEWTLTILDDIGMIEMGVRCEEHLISVKFVVHCLLFLLWHPGGNLLAHHGRYSQSAAIGIAEPIEQALELVGTGDNSTNHVNVLPES